MSIRPFFTQKTTNSDLTLAASFVAADEEDTFTFVNVSLRSCNDMAHKGHVTIQLDKALPQVQSIRFSTNTGQLTSLERQEILNIIAGSLLSAIIEEYDISSSED